MWHSGTNDSKQRRLVRRIAGLIAFVFVFVSVTVFPHHHAQHDSSSAGVTVARSAATSPFFVSAQAAVQSERSHHPVASFATVDCASCDWLATGMTTPGTVTSTVAITSSAIVQLLLQVRFAALCAAPVPRRGLRAPPLAFV
ncbi:MAG: hypothetical protein H7145_07970 [Akkermansiaceae bacterium]|nr:hypothetical protein [Armatimonadota bacterium]